MLSSWEHVPTLVPKHIFIVNIHRSPSVLVLSPLLTSSVIDHSLFCLRDRVSPLMSFSLPQVTYRTSPTFSSYDTRGDALDQIEQSIVQELAAFDNRFFVLYGYNQESHTVDSFKQTIHKDTLFTTKYFSPTGITTREGFIHAFASCTTQTANTFIHYTRISSNHYSIPSTASVDQSLHRHHLITRFIALVKTMPAPAQAASTLVVFAHNITGLLFHLPLVQLIYAHLRDDGSSTSDNLLASGYVDALSHSGVDLEEESEEGSFFSQLLSLNIIIDLCRLLSRGYSHFYRVFGIIQSTLLPNTTSNDTCLTHNDFSNTQDNFVPLTLYEYISHQYACYTNQSLSDGHNNHSFLYLRYLQALQKMVYLMIIDDYLDVCFLFLSQPRPPSLPPSRSGLRHVPKSRRFWAH